MLDKQKPLAYELADTLNDQESLALYISFTQTYQEEFLKKTLLKVMSIPDNKIKRSRGALFTYLVTHHGKASRNPRN
ncbi:MAG: hypothetical protein DWQ44_09815 [Bacteroidetes bacterium]|nr:MAG: hypothetical protein DWQ33_10090 [Bacteroidota bacterium]REK06578.1 MAG: hypothetical protein DWQ39_03605 [Bacteroidota bacterium]REK33344.1 MAG: hypothetical protein DWQ44_09815 [Bacteroidota bacterium]REK49744.1 MAG: hypothetical protein DWQ48_06370 [Bacteroidota bacterium]